MPNPLTGDFDAVLQVSGGTINRLLASMHQNTGPGANASTPSLPHRAALRIGDPVPVAGVSGTAWAQVSVPRIRLLDGSTDRFGLTVWIRARFKADPDSWPLPELIEGELRAEYVLGKVAETCPGYEHTSGEYVWPRVDPETVEFDGRASDDIDLFVIATPPDPDEVLQRITRICRSLLRTTFAPAPQRVGPRFRRGRMRSLDRPVGGPVVTVGLAPQGSVASVNQVFTAGADIAVAVSAGSIVGPVQQQLDRFRASFRPEIHFSHKSYVAGIKVLDIDIRWRIAISSATVEWGGPAPFSGSDTGVLLVRLKGLADTADDDFDIGFDVTQLVSLTYEASTERLVGAALGGPTVTVTNNGPYAGLIKSYAQPQLEAQVKAQFGAIIAQAGTLVDLTAQREELVRQLRTLDDQADARLLDAQFTRDGVVLRGPVNVAPRRRPEVSFTQVASGFSALDSWIPGGRITRLDWSWEFFQWGTAGGSESFRDRFLLRRPRDVPAGKFGGIMGLRKPLPGLDGIGRLCLTLQGQRVDPVTGAMQSFTATQRCRRWGYPVKPPFDLAKIPRLVVKPPMPGDPDFVIDLLGPKIQDALNVLVVSVGPEYEGAFELALLHALGKTRRRDAGLLILVLAEPATDLPRWADAMAHFAPQYEAPMIVGQDVDGGWAEPFGLASAAGGLAWRLVSPTGGVSWAHDGEIEPSDLAAALDGHLFATPAPFPAALDPAITVGALLTPHLLDPWLLLPTADPRCPPPPTGRSAPGGMVLVFTRPGQALGPILEGHDPSLITVVVDGVDDVGEVEGLPPHAAAVPDPEGGLSARSGIRTWPTVVVVDEHGVVEAVHAGLPPGRPARPPEDVA